MRTLISILALSLLLPAQAQPQRPRLGVKIGAEADGRVSVIEVLEKTPAQAAGIRAGDLILALGDHPVAGVDELIELVRSQKWDGATSLTILREGKQLELPVRFARPAPTAPTAPTASATPTEAARPAAPTEAARPARPGLPPVIVHPVTPPHPPLPPTQLGEHPEVLPPGGQVEIHRLHPSGSVSTHAVREALDRAAESLHTLRSIPAVHEALKEIERARTLLEQRADLGLVPEGARSSRMDLELPEPTVEELTGIEVIEEQPEPVEAEEVIEAEVEAPDVPALDMEKLMARIQDLMSSGAAQDAIQQAIAEEFPGVNVEIQVSTEPPSEVPIHLDGGHDHPVKPAPETVPAPMPGPAPEARPAPAPPTAGSAAHGHDAAPDASRRLADDLRKRIADLEALIERLSQRLREGG